MNLPAGLTCCACHRALYPSVARMTTDGWHHIDCSAFDVCATCDKPMIAASRWHKLTASERGRAVNDGYRRKDGPGICARCANARMKGERAAARRAEQDKQRADRLEDLEWMTATGENLEGAAARLDVTPGALARFLARNGRNDLCDTLTARNPRDENRQNMPGAIVNTRGERLERQRRGEAVAA